MNIRERFSAAASVRPEVQLILCAASALKDSEKIDRIRALLSNEIDWAYELRIALQNQITSLLYWYLRAARSEAVPAAVLNQLGRHFRQNSIHNLKLTRELVELLNLFHRHDIPALPFKGPVLATTLYGNLALRHFWDLDILVHKRDVLRVKRLLIERGYRPELDLSGERERTHLESNCEYNFDRIEGNVHVEVHWQILPRSAHLALDPNYVWHHAVPASLAGQTTLTIPPEELFLLLCVHGGDKHGWARLKWITDIARFVVVYEELDWERLLRQAAVLGRERTVLLGLYLASVLLGVSLPARVSERVNHYPRLSALAGLVRGRLFREDFGLPGFTEWLSYVKAGQRLQDEPVSLYRYRYLLRYVWAVMTPEWADRSSVPVPAWLSFVHYLTRPFRLARKHGAGLLRRLR